MTTNEKDFAYEARLFNYAGIAFLILVLALMFWFWVLPFSWLWFP
jgi:hypothetical protein